MRYAGETLVHRPEGKIGAYGSGEQVHIDPTQPLAHETLVFDQSKDIPVIDDGRVRKSSQQGEDFAPSRQVAAGELANDEAVRPHVSRLEARREGRIASTEV